MLRKLIIFHISIFMMCSSLALADSHEGWSPLKDRLVKDGFNLEYVEAIFSATSVEYNSDIMARKMRVLLKRRFEPPAKKVAREKEFDERYVGPVLLAGAYAYLREHYDILVQIDKEYGVAPSVVVALLLVETKLGFTLGKAPAFNNLANMAASSDPLLFFDDLGYEKLEDNDLKWLKKRTKKKADWAYRELAALLTFSSANSINPAEIPGSPYGAFGICQFMPTTALSYAVDGDKDGQIDLFKREDALVSMANFMKKHGWKNSLSKAKKLKVIYRYNHSMVYARTIYEVAKQLDRIRSTFGPT
ncbi:lytic murein transglycosylase [Maridesulfovibrio hydrothermalis]|uniref:Membrane-bound lytic murein transglycosylase B-like protein n=1 Tax=Maridesulfovibrio hydrothermalis AM13 = DSM 14728 TaxID=1121451 RepID=L0RDX4_9BACT|nr:lytic murein transglycosylase [Maridesulfovibrio hydrothermalis]CCO24983.1 Membrane-bound lytic murein transglycosylase B-like protein [Maridesulfovibrio hydrothermalis AM13 = DSM 14728]